MSENGVKEELIRQVAEIRQKLGTLEGKMDTLAGDIMDIKADIKALNSFRWRVYGAVATIGFLAGILGTLITMMAYAHP